ncbi:sugar O-acetyltransferase [Chitinophaga horti]|uniref:Sugar O-acetyltransferase n=1 Tax=Chitinophaga horti TaxID=2920382 RepID=A0ABY6IXP1_9BACT|nr:sugar O-acetyltransferase [Chitinophaga horti]UYQ91177.1 sugar O-acetyltransferase [Chitinophaga horti]
MRTEKEKMLAGELYNAGSPELQADSLANARWMIRYNQSAPEEREALLKEGLGKVGEQVNIRPPFHCDYGYNILLGDGVVMNFNCIILDVMPVHIGDMTQIGPGVQILTADHPRDPEQRKAGLESGKAIHIGKNVWIGGGALLMPGITVGDDAIIGAGSVVTKNVPAGATVVGNPARVVPKS